MSLTTDGEYIYCGTRRIERIDPTRAAQALRQAGYGASATAIAYGALVTRQGAIELGQRRGLLAGT